jgi:hypothetical protein
MQGLPTKVHDAGHRARVSKRESTAADSYAHEGNHPFFRPF